MNIPNITMPELFFSGATLAGNSITKSLRTAGDLAGIFADETVWAALPPDKPVYEVYMHLSVPEGTEGGLFFGLTRLFSGKVGNEYFMTKGHFHRKIDRMEYYWGLEGEGILILMDENRQTRAEKMFPGSLHLIGGGIAHRVANTGNVPLSFAACWASDAGHNYEEIASNGFSARLMEINGNPQLCTI